MEDADLFGELKHGDGEDVAPLEPLLRELWAARDRDLPPAELRLAAAEELARALVDRGVTIAAAVELVLVDGRTLVERARAGGLLDAAGTRRLAALVDGAAVQVAAALEKARARRRQAWLGFLAHEFKNPLNTVLNALWLLRERAGDIEQAARFLDLAERAVRRLEARVLDMRALDEQLTAPPPGWEGQRDHR
jgi:signal transduction histidine kinase